MFIYIENNIPIAKVIIKGNPKANKLAANAANAMGNISTGFLGCSQRGASYRACVYIVIRKIKVVWVTLQTAKEA